MRSGSTRDRSADVIDDRAGGRGFAAANPLANRPFGERSGVGSPDLALSARRSRREVVTLESSAAGSLTHALRDVGYSPR